MKKIAYIVIAVIFAGLLGWAYFSYAAYLPGYSRSIAEALLIDKTEQFERQPDAGEILSTLGMPDHKWQRVQLSIRTLSEYEYTESYPLSLPGGVALFSNPDDRDKEIDSFKRKISSTVNMINGQKNGYVKSSVYAPLIEEVNRIAAIKADVKTVVAYTDLGENTSEYSVYRQKDRDLLLRHPEKVRALLARYGTPGNLSGVTIYIVFKPRTDRDNECFGLMSGFYKKLFEDAGAKVYVGANISCNNN